MRYLLDANTIILALTGAHPLLRQADLHLQARFRVAFTGVAALLYLVAVLIGSRQASRAEVVA